MNYRPPGALGRRRRGAALIDQYAHPLSADEYSGNRRAISTLKRYSDPGDYHSPIVGAFELAGTGAIPQVADLLRLLKDRHLPRRVPPPLASPNPDTPYSSGGASTRLTGPLGPHTG